MSTSLRNHPSFKYLIQRCFPLDFGTFTFIRKVSIGRFSNKSNIGIKLEFEESGYDGDSSDNMVFTFRCIRENNIYNLDSNVIYEQRWVVPYDYEYIMRNVDQEVKILMETMDEMNECSHCGVYIFLETAIDDKCFSCGLQNIYDEINSDSTCTICLQSVGYGTVKKCKNKHLMHSYCFIKYNFETNKDLCPLRCGSIIE